MTVPRSLAFTFCLLWTFAACRARPDAMPAADSLQQTIEKIVAQRPEATVAVSVRDAQTATALSLRGERVFHAASTMKIPVMIEIYRQAARGRFSLDDSLVVENAFRSIVDGSRFRIEDDSDDALYARLGHKMPIRELVYQMITVSSNLATNLLIDFVSADSVQATSERLGVTTMRVLRGVEDLKAYRQGLSNTATAEDLATLLEALRRGEAVSPEADRAMIDVLLDQRFNTMIPAGLPAGTRVAHKTGWITEIHHDAALVFPAQGEPYVLVVLTEGIEAEEASARLGAEIARAVHAALRPGA